MKNFIFSAFNGTLRPPRKPVKVRILIAGPESSGKTCLIKRYCEKRFVQKYSPTVGIDYGATKLTVDQKEISVHIFDTSGSNLFRWGTKSMIFYVNISRMNGSLLFWFLGMSDLNSTANLTASFWCSTSAVERPSTPSISGSKKSSWSWPRRERTSTKHPSSYAPTNVILAVIIRLLLLPLLRVGKWTRWRRGCGLSWGNKNLNYNLSWILIVIFQGVSVIRNVSRDRGRYQGTQIFRVLRTRTVGDSLFLIKF